MLLIPGRCLAILRAVWNFITFGFSKASAWGSGKPSFRYKHKNAKPSAKQQGDSKIAAIVDDIGDNGEGSA